MKRLSERELNRSLLMRQKLLSQSMEDLTSVFSVCAGIQSQKPSTMLLGLWNRAANFNPCDLDRLLLSGQVVRMAVMRSTVHAVLAGDAYTFRTATQKVLNDEVSNNYSKLAVSDESAKVVRHAEKKISAGVISARVLANELHHKWPEHSPKALLALVRSKLPLVQVPPRGLWGHSAATSYQLLNTWSPDLRPTRPRERRSKEVLITRYLAAFGPAMIADAQVWSGLTGLKEIFEEMRPKLVKYIGPNGEVLYDLAGCSVGSAETEAPVRFMGEFDNVILSHSNRERIISQANRKRIRSPNGQVPAVLLVDGYVVGSWRINDDAVERRIHTDLFRTLTSSEKECVESAQNRLLSFLNARPTS